MQMKCIVMFVLLSLMGQPMYADGTTVLLPWTQTTYRASKFFLTATVEVSLRMAKLAEVEAALNPAGTHVPLTPGTNAHVQTTIETRIARQDTQIELWHGTNLQVLQRTALYTGRKNWLRMTRYTLDGVYSLKRRPSADETGKTPSQWSDRSEDFYPYAGDLKKHPITEPEAVFYALALSSIQQPGDQIELFVEHHGQSQRLAIRAEGKRRMSVDYERIEERNPVRINTDVEVLQVIMHPVDSAEDAKFLGLNGDIDLFFDPVSRLIVELKGSANVIGEVRFLLQRVTASSIAR